VQSKHKFSPENNHNYCLIYAVQKVLDYHTRPAKIDHVGTLIYLRNTNLKYSMPHNFPVPDSNHIRFTWEVQQGNSYVLVNNHTSMSMYLLLEFASFSQSFQTQHKLLQVLHIRRQVSVSRGVVEGVGGGLRLPFRNNGTSYMPKKMSMVSKPYYKAKQAIQLQTWMTVSSFTPTSPFKFCQSLPQSYQRH